MDLNTLLQRAQNLTNGNKVESETELPRVERTLQQVLQATEEFHNRVTQQTQSGGGSGGQDILAHILLGSKGIDLPKLNQKLEALSTRKTFAPLDSGGVETDVCTFLKNERENAILSVIEDTNKNISESVSKQKWTNLLSSWNEEKTRLLDALVGPSQNFIDLQRLPEQIIVNPQCQPRSCLDQMELLYAQELRQYNELLLKGASRPNLVQKYAQLAHCFGDPRLTDMWTLLARVTELSEPCHSDPIKMRQQCPDFVHHAKTYLEERYRLYMNSLLPALGSECLESYQLVRTFVGQRFNTHQTIGLVDTCGGGKPLWPLVYYSLRCGASSTAVAFLREAGSSNSEDFAQLVSDRSSGVVNSKIEGQLKLQYANKIRNSTDAYKKAVYCIMLGCDANEVHSEVAKTIDDFLWLKLAMLRPGDAAGYGSLQSLILEKYGEKYFNASQQAHLYFQTLALTGQFEAAIEFLARSEANRCHAVHMAIALHELGLLGSPRSVSQPLLSIDILDPSPLRRLNLARLIRLYVQRIERTDTVEALHYYYTLRGFCDASGQNMFLVCVRELVVDSGVLDTSIFDLIFGQRTVVGAESQIMSGLFQQFNCAEFNTQTMAGLVADELVQRGNFEMAVRLYDLADNHNLALKHVSILLAQVVHQPPAEGTLRSRLTAVVSRYSNRLDNWRELSIEPKVLSSYVLLQDLLAFFDQYHGGNMMSAAQLLQRTQLIPNNYQEVDSCLNHIKRLSGEVIKVLPDVMVAAMDITHSQYKHLKESHAEERQLERLREQAKAVASMAATMPYRMPADTNRRLVQLELLMH